MGEILFVCTKPYQYLIARLIKEGYTEKSCDILVLNHFYNAKEFSQKISNIGVWENVFYEDDSALREHVKNLPYYKKFFFYSNWNHIIPNNFKDVDQYKELFIAHDTVTLEYALMKKFKSEKKNIYLFEEGTGNYVNTNIHKSLFKKIVREVSYIVGMPSSYLGKSREIEAIYLSKPDIIKNMRFNPIKKKVVNLPLDLDVFLNKPNIKKEFYNIYPELSSIGKEIQSYEEVSILLTQPSFDEIQDRKLFLKELVNKVKGNSGSNELVIFIKQHPGEKKDFPNIDGVKILPKHLPIEMIKLIINNNIKNINLFTFGSTAAFTFNELFRSSSSNIDIYLFDNVNQEVYFKELATKFGIKYHNV